MKLFAEQIKEFSDYLRREEKSPATMEKYLRDVRVFCAYAGSNEITKELVVEWKKHLVESGYAVRSINSMLASLNSLLDFLGGSDCKVKAIRQQKQVYCTEEKELSKAEYMRLLEAAKKVIEAYQAGEDLGLSAEELAFYDALTKPAAIKDFYENDVLVEMTRELTELLRKNRTIDWQKKETARATMRKMVKRLLKKYKYPPDQYEDAIETVMSQCEMWTDNMQI